MAVTKLSDLNRNDIEDNGTSTKGSFRVRPSGYQFPVGLNKSTEGLEPNTYITTVNSTINAYGPSSDPTRVAYSWTTTGSFEHNLGSDLTADVLIVAGGGAGQSGSPLSGGQAGGGGGGILYYSDTNGITGPPGPASANSKSPNGPAVNLSSGVSFAVVVGGGGVGQLTPSSDSGNGTDSSITAPPGTFSNLTATGGGSANYSPSQQQPGGSGSGAGPGSTGAGTGIAGQGNPGGPSTDPSGNFTAGGGGGAGGPGSDRTDLNPRSGKDGNAPSIADLGNLRYASGGDGLDFDISGTQRTYAAGGGGSGRTQAFYGGSDNLGGRGDGSYSPDDVNFFSPWSPEHIGGNGTVSRGSGGGGGKTGGNGGGGVVIIQFRKDDTNFTFDVN